MKKKKLSNNIIFLEVKLGEFELFYKMLLIVFTENYKIWLTFFFILYYVEYHFLQKFCCMISLIIRSQKTLPLSLVS